NAEHAIKAFVRLRRSVDGKSSPKGIRDYLVLLSVSESCKCRGVSFLDFLRSEQTDIASFEPVSARAKNPPLPAQLNLMRLRTVLTRYTGQPTEQTGKGA